ncbi:hypothetical protein QYF36_018677 [Acer negundo]|nr:hypothetical protein QYF36_018677 [Acer negundo]
MALDNVYNQIKILAARIEYYINEGRYPFLNPKHNEDFYMKMLRFMKLSLSECWLAIHRAKRTYDNLVGKKGYALVFWSLDDLLMFNLSKIIWGSEGQLSQVEIDMKFLSTLIDYFYINWRFPFEEAEYREVFYKNCMDMTIPFFRDNIDRSNTEIKKLEKRIDEIVDRLYEDFSPSIGVANIGSNYCTAVHLKSHDGFEIEESGTAGTASSSMAKTEHPDKPHHQVTDAWKSAN